ncbi:MAG: 23S rRNA (pseudouridine(1915)-N(3))-methyltransferase RlmH [Gammaproteobacteria bacterium]|nr:23S rRNA (pseudouridine(1915)-N(3))-methyltransferase RlmH [Gammaproteobacteria bacterium]
MAIKLLAVGRNMPNWVNEAFQDYVKRLPTEYAIDILEIRPEVRGKNENIAKIIEREGEKILKAVPDQHVIIALDERGTSWNTQQLATQLKRWREEQMKICLIIGGPDGLSDACRQRAQQIWSLSPLTLPHPLVRVIIAEQIYRAWSILTNHPYHRA